MKQLGAIQYDPAVSVSKATTAGTAMAAFDTTNARLTVTVPQSGRIYWKVQTAIHGAATYPQILLGVMEGVTVRGRKSAMLAGSNLAATTICAAWAEGTITGLTPGASITLDAAWGCETGVASTGLKYGGANDTTVNNAFGALGFELWDPAPIANDSSGRVTVGTNADKTGYSLTQAFPTNFSALAITAGGAVTAGTVSDKSGYSLTTAPLDAAGTRAALGLASANLDTQLGTLATSATLALVKASTDNLPIDPADQSLVIAATDAIMGRLGAPAGVSVSADIAAVKSDTGAVKAKTDSLTFTVAGKLDVNVLIVNGVTLQGAGTAADPWRPA